MKHSEPVFSILFSPNERFLASVDLKSELIIWSTRVKTLHLFNYLIDIDPSAIPFVQIMSNLRPSLTTYLVCFFLLADLDTPIHREM
jgi:WD40 repeat protein